MNQEDIEQITKDFHRFAKLHSYYKHLPIDKSVFIFFKEQGQQERYNFDKCLTEQEQEKEYWYFIELKYNKDYVKKLFESGKQLYWVKFGAFLRGLENNSYSYKHCRGFDIIEKNSKEKKWNYLKNRYPQYIDFEPDNFYHNISDDIVNKIYENEYQEYLNEVLDFKTYVIDF